MQRLNELRVCLAGVILAALTSAQSIQPAFCDGGASTPAPASASAQTGAVSTDDDADP